jgi:hypothetical protein
MKKKDQILLEQAYEAILKPDAAGTSMRQRTPDQHNARRIANQIGVKLEGRGYKHLEQGTGHGTHDGGSIHYYGNNESAVVIKYGNDGSFQGAVYFDSPKAGKILTYNGPATLEDARKVVDAAEGVAVGMPIEKLEDLYRHL